MSVLLNISIISSRTGGTPGEVDAHDRETTIRRIQQAVEALVSEHVSPGQISTVKTHVKRPIGAMRRLGRGSGGVRTTTLQFWIALGTFMDMDRSGVIRHCQEEVPALVTANVPADHLCSLVIALKES